MAFDDGDLDDIGGVIIYEIAPFIDGYCRRPFASHDAAGDNIYRMDRRRAQGHAQLVGRKTSQMYRMADGAGIGPRKRRNIRPFERNLLAGNKGLPNGKLLQIIKQDDVGPFSRRQSAAVRQAVAFGSVERRHRDGSFRRNAVPHAQPQVLVQMALGKYRFQMQIVGTQQEPAKVLRRDGADEIRQIAAGRTVSQEDVHAEGNSLQRFLGSGAFMVRPNSGSGVSLQPAAMEARTVTVDDLACFMGRR